MPIGKADRVTQPLGTLAIGFVVILFKCTGPARDSLEGLSGIAHVHKNTKLFYLIYGL